MGGEKIRRLVLLFTLRISYYEGLTEYSRTYFVILSEAKNPIGDGEKI